MIKAEPLHLECSFRPLRISVLIAVLISFVVWWLRFDYTWAEGDQDEFIPYLLHLTDPDLLAADWFVQTQTAAFGVRTPFVYLLYVLTTFLSPEIAVATVFVSSWIAIACAVYCITRSLGGTEIAAMTCVLVVTCLTPKWTLGGNDVVYNMLVPEMVAWALALPALVCFYRERFVLAGVLVGVSAWFQLLVGIQLLGVLSCVVVLWPRSPLKDRLMQLAGFGITGALLLAPMLINTVMQQVSAVEVAGAGPDLTSVLTSFRAPYHYLPSSFPLTSYIKLTVLAGLGVAALLGFKMSRTCTRNHHVAALILATIALTCGAASILTEIVRIDAVVKLQLFKTTVVAKVLLVSLACAFAGRLRGVATFSLGNLAVPRPSIAAGVVLATIVCGFSFLLVRESTTQAPDDRLTEWARAATRPDDVFLIPPSNSAFRSRAGRPIVVNYAAVPFSPSDLREWYRRITDVAPVDNPARSIRLKAQLDSSFHALPIARLLALADKYSISYLVQKHRASARESLSVAYQDSFWVVYGLRPAASDR